MSKSKSTAPSMVSCTCFITDSAHLKNFFSDAIGLKLGFHMYGYGMRNAFCVIPSMRNAVRFISLSASD